ncbi:MAG: pyridoxal phosphate-dependent aminotransferase [Rubripirellula sp.]
MSLLNKAETNSKYDPGIEIDSNKVLCLHRNENLFISKEWMRDFVSHAASQVDVLRYPETSSLELRKSLAKHYGVMAENVFVGNGSDEVLACVLHLLRDRYQTLATLDVHFKVYDLLADRLDYRHETIPGATFETEKIATTAWRGLALVDSPNAITGLGLDQRYLRRLTESPEAFLIWDNAYGEYAGDQCPSDLPENMIIVRSFSKFFGLAGARVGYCIGGHQIIDQLLSRKDVFNVNAFGQQLALHALSRHSEFAQFREEVIRCRNVLKRNLRERGFHVREPSGNHIFATHERLSACYIQEQLLIRNVAVRRFPGAPTDNFLRFTVPPLDGIDRLMACLDKIVPR